MGNKVITNNNLYINEKEENPLYNSENINLRKKNKK
jgi:hypothetical protein